MPNYPLQSDPPRTVSFLQEVSVLMYPAIRQALTLPALCAQAAGANAPTSRRAAAAAASLTIAKIVASENRPIMPMRLPPQQPPPDNAPGQGEETKSAVKSTRLSS
jgi:hypothetical protein